MDTNFTNPTAFTPSGVFDYLDREKNTAFIKRTPFDFIVREPVPGVPGRFLTVGPDSDFPGKLTDNRPHRMVAATLVKERLTTSDACGRLAKQLGQTLGRYVDPDAIQNSGLKDRWAVTAQTVVIPGVTVDEVRRCTWNYTPGRAGFFLKDIRPAHQELEMGDHGANRFNLVVRSEGMTAGDIEAYMAPRLEKLSRRGMWIPNAYGRQRLGRRQNLHLVGHALVSGEAKAPAGVPEFGSAAEAAVYMFLFHSTSSEPPAARAVREKASGYWLYNFEEMKQLFGKHYRQLNLSLEYKIVERLADIDRYGGSFERVLASMKKDSSLFVAAWQSYWWNQVLARKLPAWTREMEETQEANKKWVSTPCTCRGGKTNWHAGTATGSFRDTSENEDCYRCNARQERRFNPSKKSIPMLMSTSEAKAYYGRLSYCQSAMRELAQVDSTVRDMYLLPRARRGDQGNARGPWRKAFIRVENLTGHYADGEWHCEFDLRSGAYATTFLSLLWNLADPDEQPESQAQESAEASS